MPTANCVSLIERSRVDLLAAAPASKLPCEVRAMGALPAHHVGQGDVVGLAGNGFHALLLEGDADHGGIGPQMGKQLVVVAAAIA